VVTVDTLDVPGAHLRYRVIGSGPVLLLIPGGPADATAFADIAPLLAEDHTVVTYDPRGISHSTRDDNSDDVPVDVQADDAHRLLATLGTAPADVFGSSGGAITGLELVARHSEQVRVLVAHEPPVTELLTDAEAHRASMADVADTYRSAGVGPAMGKFLAHAGIDMGSAPPKPGPPSPERLATMARMKGNLELFFSHMLHPIVDYRPDETVLQAATTRIVVGAGTTSAGQTAHSAAVALADLLATKATEFPGGHGGFGEEPDAFAATLRAVLATSGD
jgi:pimeloyl-ACP methyl ester carboxylesterase